MAEVKKIEILTDKIPVEDTDRVCMDNLLENDNSGPNLGSDLKDVVHKQNSIEIYYELNDHLPEHEESNCSEDDILDHAHKGDFDLAKRSDPENTDKGHADCTNKNDIDLTIKCDPELANKSDPNLTNKSDPDITNKSDPDLASKSESNLEFKQSKDKNDADRASRDGTGVSRDLDNKSKDSFDKHNEKSRLVLKSDMSQERDTNTHAPILSTNIKYGTDKKDQRNIDTTVSGKKVVANRLRERSKWRIVQKASHSEKSPPPNRGYDLDAHFDLRSIPLRINQYDTGFDKQLKLPTIIGAFKTASEKPENHNSMTKAEQEDLKFKRQEQFLKAYTTVYDLESGKMVNYHDMQSQKKMSHTQNCYALSNTKPKRKRMCIIS